MNRFNEVAHMQMRREQLNKLEAAAAQDDTTPSFMEEIEFVAILMAMRFYVWLIASVYGAAMSVSNVFSRSASNDFRLIEFKVMALGVFLSAVRNKTERLNCVVDVFETLLECVEQARRDQACVLARIHDAGSIDAIENGDLRAEFERVNAQVELVIQKVNAMYREAVTFRNIWRA